MWGRGFTVNVLRSVPWLQRCKLLYWGDIDAHGFQILALFRTQYPQTQALMMDRATIESFRAYCVAGTPTKISQLARLTPTEQALYDYLVTNNLRLEQEHIAQAYVRVALCAALSLL
ncbi:MAG: DUF2399 domain-containing protein [Anaerolineae bacterium]|nr:DUF2399 domain-containing protein [Anaerolineae bacterium]